MTARAGPCGRRGIFGTQRASALHSAYLFVATFALRGIVRKRLGCLVLSFGAGPCNPKLPSFLTACTLRQPSCGRAQASPRTVHSLASSRSRLLQHERHSPCHRRYVACPPLRHAPTLTSKATGLLGSQVAQAFDARGWKTVGTGLTRASPPSTIKLDLLDSAAIEEALDEVKYGRRSA